MIIIVMICQATHNEPAIYKEIVVFTQMSHDGKCVYVITHNSDLMVVEQTLLAGVASEKGSLINDTS